MKDLTELVRDLGKQIEAARKEAERLYSGIEMRDEMRKQQFICDRVRVYQGGMGYQLLAEGPLITANGIRHKRNRGGTFL